jgi:hypothetical protein
VRFFDGGKETRSVQVPNGATSIRFSADGKTLHLGSHDVDPATGAVTTANAPTDLAPWAKQAGLPAPASLGLGATAASADGKLIVGGASGSRWAHPRARCSGSPSLPRLSAVHRKLATITPLLPVRKIGGRRQSTRGSSRRRAP